MPQLGPWDGLTGLTLAGPSLYRHTQPLHRPRASSHYPRTRPQRPYHYSCAPGQSGAASIALGPPHPQGRSVLPPRRARGSTAFMRASGAHVRFKKSEPQGGAAGQPRAATVASKRARHRAERGGLRLNVRAHLQTLRAHLVLAAAGALHAWRPPALRTGVLKQRTSLLGQGGLHPLCRSGGRVPCGTPNFFLGRAGFFG